MKYLQYKQDLKQLRIKLGYSAWLNKESLEKLEKLWKV